MEDRIIHPQNGTGFFFFSGWFLETGFQYAAQADLEAAL
jgi:hypothetical protein